MQQALVFAGQSNIKPANSVNIVPVQRMFSCDELILTQSTNEMAPLLQQRQAPHMSCNLASWQTSYQQLEGKIGQLSYKSGLDRMRINSIAQVILISLLLRLGTKLSS